MVVVRDWNGEFVVGFSKLIRSSLSIEHVEATAALAAIKFVVELGFKKVVLEGDANTITNAIEQKEKNLSEIETFIHQVHKYADQLVEFSISWVRRTGNMVSNCFSKYAVNCNDSCCWKETAGGGRVCPFRVLLCLMVLTFSCVMPMSAPPNLHLK